MIRRIFWVLLIGGTHFVLGRLVIPLATNRLLAITDNGQSFTWLVQLLIWTTRVLYFPIITLSLYSREWFPGNLIYIPIVINSLLCGILIYGVLRVIEKIGR